MKCTKCGELNTEADVLVVKPGLFYLDASLCMANKITVIQDGKDMTGKCVGVVTLEPKYFGENGKDSKTD